MQQCNLSITSPVKFDVSVFIYHIFITYLLRIYCLFIAYLLPIYYVLIFFLLSIAYLLHIYLLHILGKELKAMLKKESGGGSSDEEDEDEDIDSEYSKSAIFIQGA